MGVSGARLANAGLRATERVVMQEITKVMRGRTYEPQRRAEMTKLVSSNVHGSRELTVDEMDLVSGGLITQRLPDGGYGPNGVQSGQWSPYSDMAYSTWLLMFQKNQ
jgi:hypothetical protein